MLQVKEESEDHSGEKEEVMPEQTGKKRKEHAAQAAQDLQVHFAPGVGSRHLSPELCLALPSACSLLCSRIFCQALDPCMCRLRAHDHQLALASAVSLLKHALDMARRMMTRMRPRRRV